MKVLKILGGVVAALVLVVVAVFIGARFADGPIAIIPGGPLSSGEWADDGPVDWSFATDIQEIEFESAGRSRTTWIIVREGEAYVPCSLAFPPGKSWHHAILEQPDGVVRVEGKRYRRQFIKVEDAEVQSALVALARDKYAPPPGSSEDNIWFFHIQPRDQDG